MEIKAEAKINLSILVKGKRTDSFHELDMLIQAVDIYDIINIEKTEKGLEFTSNVESLARDEENSVIKAAKLMREKYGLPGGLRIHLEKKIPLASGLGGGSSDAAAVIRAICGLYDIDAASNELDELALKIGTEVVYFLRSGLCRVRGKGEIVEKLKIDIPFRFLIVKPRRGLSTKDVYMSLSQSDYTENGTNDCLIRNLKNRDYPAAFEAMTNGLERVAIDLEPEIKYIKTKLYDFGAIKSLMSGSGPSVFGIFDNDEKLEKALIWAKSKDYSVFETRAI